MNNQVDVFLDNLELGYPARVAYERACHTKPDLPTQRRLGDLQTLLYVPKALVTWIVDAWLRRKLKMDYKGESSHV